MTAMGENISSEIQADFQYDLDRADFPFVEDIRQNKDFQDQLLTEFSELSMEPKLYFYFRKFISDEVWKRNCLSNKVPVHSSTNRGIVAANFIADTETDILASKVISDFDDLQRKKSVPSDCYGRVLKKAKTVELLREVDTHINKIRKYVLQNRNVSDYKDFATTSTRKLIRLLNQLSINGLGSHLATYFLKLSANDDFRMMLYFSNVEGADEVDFSEKFSILKDFGDEIMLSEYAPLHNQVQIEQKSGPAEDYTNDSFPTDHLRNQFKDPLKYETIINKLLKSGKIRQSADVYRFILVPFRKNAQYEAVSMFDAIKQKGLFKQSDYSSREIRSILQNTLLGWDIGERSIIDKRTIKRLIDYLTIIS